MPLNIKARVVAVLDVAVWRPGASCRKKEISQNTAAAKTREMLDLLQQKESCGQCVEDAAASQLQLLQYFSKRTLSS